MLPCSWVCPPQCTHTSKALLSQYKILLSRDWESEHAKMESFSFQHGNDWLGISCETISELLNKHASSSANEAPIHISDKLCSTPQRKTLVNTTGSAHAAKKLCIRPQLQYLEALAWLNSQRPRLPSQHHQLARKKLTSTILSQLPLIALADPIPTQQSAFKSTKIRTLQSIIK